MTSRLSTTYSLLLFVLLTTPKGFTVVDRKYPIIDVSEWDVFRGEPMGTKAKDWRTDPREIDSKGRRWLLKLSM